MSLDNYREEIVVKHNQLANNLLYGILCVLMVLFGLMAAIYLAGMSYSENLIISIIWLVVYGGLAFLIWWKKDLLRTEYEYTFTNGELDIACVYGNKKRASKGSMRVKNVEACGLVRSGSFQRYITMPGVKKNNWFLNRDAELLYFFFQKDSVKRVIIIEPTEEMREMIKLYLPRGVFQTN